MTIKDAQELFDLIVLSCSHFNFSKYLSIDSECIYNKFLEAVVVKLQCNRLDLLIDFQKRSITKLLLLIKNIGHGEEEERESKTCFAHLALKWGRMEEEKFESSKYINTRFTLLTPYVKERLFSMSSRVSHPYRRTYIQKHCTPSISLNQNKSVWNLPFLAHVVNNSQHDKNEADLERFW